jgi:2-iminobutanoate/2-iminopropanoate deaminase
MLRRPTFLALAALAMSSGSALAQSASPNGVVTLSPPGAFKAEGTWSLATRAGDFVFLSGMPGIDPATNSLVKEPLAQIRQAFRNIRLIAQSQGASLQDCVRLTVYVSDLNRFAPLVDQAETELWGRPPYPPRTLVEVQRLFDDMVVEVESTFYAPVKK